MTLLGSFFDLQKPNIVIYYVYIVGLAPTKLTQAILPELLVWFLCITLNGAMPQVSCILQEVSSILQEVSSILQEVL